MLHNSNTSKKGVISLKNTVKWFGIIAIVVVNGFSTASCNGSGDSLGNAKWEYMVFNGRANYSSSEIEELKKKFNELGSQGWELVSTGLTSLSTAELYLILKRK